MTGMAALVRDLRAALGQTMLDIHYEHDYLVIAWAEGQITLMVLDLTEHDWDDDPNPTRFLITYRALDGFGSTGRPERSYRLPVGTTNRDLVTCLIHEIRWRQHGIPTPSPYCWGQLTTSRITDLADALLAAGLKPTLMSQTILQVPANGAGRGVTALTYEDEEPGGPMSLYVGRPDAQGLTDLHAAVGWNFAAAAPAQLIAATAAYWAHEGQADDPDDRLSPERPLPLPRYGLTRHIDAGIGPLLEHLHRAGLQVLRVDLAINRGGEEDVLPGQDVITFRDDDGRLLLLARRPGADAPWALHAAAYGRRLEVPLIGLQMPAAHALTTVPDDPAGTSAARVAAQVAAAVAALPAVGNDEGLLDVPQPFPASALELIKPAYLHDVFIDLRQQLAGLAGSTEPEPTPIRTPHDAEQSAARWMRWMGFSDAAVTPIGTDEGIDVHSSLALAQVKTETVPVGRPALQRLFGVAHAEGKDGLFFSLSGYTAQALEWADRVELPLFTFDYEGAVVPANDHAHELFQTAGR